MAEVSEQPITPDAATASKEKQSVIEAHREKRLAMWKTMSEQMKKHPNITRVISAAVNATVGAYVKLSAEAYSGKTIDQQKLTPLGRIVHTFIVATGLASYGLVAAGHPQLAAITYGSSWAAYALMYGPEIINPTLNGAADKLGAKHEKTANVFRMIAKAVEQPKKLFFKQ